MAVEDFYPRRFGSVEAMAEAFERATAEAARSGLELRYDLMRRAPNTRLGHRLVALAARQGRGAEALAALFAGTAVEARVSDDIVQALWEKWVMIAASAALTCLLRGTVGEIMATDGGEAVAEAMTAECRAIAAALGHAPQPEAEERTRRQLTDAGSRWAASMMRDIEAGAPRLEAEHVIGDLIRRGQAAGVAAPLLRAAYAQLQIHNARGSAPRLAQPRPDAA
jgi:2-dehydropantoate 2-reductase